MPGASRFRYLHEYFVCRDAFLGKGGCLVCTGSRRVDVTVKNRHLMLFLRSFLIVIYEHLLLES